MTLNKQQRHTAYILMLAEAKRFGKDDSMAKFGLCYMIMYMFDGKYNHYFDPFHELRRKKPSRMHNSYYWFKPGTKGGWKKRIDILKQCINETA